MASLSATDGCQVRRDLGSENCRGPLSNLDGTGSNKLPIFRHKKLMLEKATDFARFVDFKTMSVPILCGDKPGDKTGHVFVFFSRKHLKSLNKEFIKGYRECLGELINIKKWIESGPLNDNRDIGPAESVARLIEGGDYNKFLSFVENGDCDEIKKLMNEGRYTQFLKMMSGFKTKFEGFEHILLIKENGKSYHLMPVTDRLAFKSYEQLGLIKYSVYQSILDNIHSFHNTLNGEYLKQRYVDRIMEWCKDENGAELFAKIVGDEEHKGTRITQFYESGRIYDKCVILENMFEKVKTIFCAHK